MTGNARSASRVWERQVRVHRFVAPGIMESEHAEPLPEGCEWDAHSGLFSCACKLCGARFDCRSPGEKCLDCYRAECTEMYEEEQRLAGD